MSLLKSTRVDAFSSTLANPNVHGKNVIYLRKGSTCIGTRWVHFPDRTIDVDTLIEDFILNDRKLFRKLNDIRYVLVAMDQNGTLQVLKSIEEQVNDDAEIKVFEDLSDVAPLVLVRITQDGSSGLTGIKDLSDRDLEVYSGYGNFTIKGEQGPIGYVGPTGQMGLQGPQGITGYPGNVGVRGDTGDKGYTGINILGLTGPRGRPGTC